MHGAQTTDVPKRLQNLSICSAPAPQPIKRNHRVRVSNIYLQICSASASSKATSQRRSATSQKKGLGAQFSIITPSTSVRKFQETQQPEDFPSVSYVVHSKHRGALIADQKTNVPNNHSLTFHAVVSIAHQPSHKDWTEESCLLARFPQSSQIQ